MKPKSKLTLRSASRRPDRADASLAFERDAGGLCRFLELQSNAVIVADTSGTIRFLNSAAEAMAAVSVDDVAGKPVDTILSLAVEPSSNRMQSLENDVTSSGTALPLRGLLSIKDGEEQSVSYRKDSFPMESGSLTVYTIAADMPSSDMSGEAGGRARYQTLFENAYDAIFVMQDDRFVDCNPRTLEMFGYTREELLSMTPAMISPELQPGGRESAEASEEHIGLASGGTPQVFAWQHLRSDGGVFDAEVSLSRMDTDDDPRILAIVRDVTERTDVIGKLMESEERYRTLVDGSPIPIMVHSGGRIVFMNTVASRLLGGISGENFLGRPIWDILHPDFREAGIERAEAVYARRAMPGKWETRMIRMDGTAIDIEAVGSPVDFRGKPSSQVVFQDVTRRNQAQAALRETEERFRELFDHMSSGVAVYSAVDDGAEFILNDINSAGEAVCRVDKQAVIGKTLGESFTGAFELGLYQVMGRVWRTGEPVRLPAVEYNDARTSFWVENYVFKLPSGEIVSIFDDVSERKRMEDAVRESEEHYRSLIETMTEGLAIRNGQGILTFVNVAFCQMLGYSRQELIGTDPKVHLSARSRVELEEQAIKRRQGESGPYELEWVRKDGSSITTIVSPEATYDVSGRMAGAFAVFTDITERKVTEDMLRKTTEELTAERRALTEKNITLNQILKHIEKEKSEFKELLYSDLEAVLKKSLALLADSAPDDLERELDELDRQLKGVLSTRIEPFKSRYSHLSAREVEICELIEDGMSSKQISEELNLSLLTIHKHRESIRKKLGIQNKDINLNTFLRSH